jgi:hypothetical protein
LVYSSLGLQEYTGADISSSRVQGDSTGTGDSTSPVTGTVTAPSQGGAFVGALVYNNEGTDPMTVGPNYTKIYDTSDLAYLPCSFMDYLVTSNVTTNASWTVTGGDAPQPWAAALICYKAASSSGPTYTAVTSVSRSNISAINGVSVSSLKNIDGLS